MATWGMLASVSQSAKPSRSRVIVPNVLSSMIPSASWPVGSGTIRQAVILFLWTSKPAHRVNTTSMPHLHASQGLAGYPEQERLPCVLDFPQEAGHSLLCRQGSRASSVAGSGRPSQNSPPTQSFGTYSTLLLGQGIELAYFHGSWCPQGHESSVASFHFNWLTGCEF